ncbi:hypothetical protein AcV7_009374 [Taiwanofungus camphoratus]|nr:hypothetical protein AcV7_009374 [Antrodia cinnamomea]
MAAVVSSSYVPRQGILLNPSPSVSPYHHSVSLPPLVPSNSSLSSSASSVSNLNTDSDYFSASTHASPAVAGTHNPHVAHQQKPCAGSMPTTSRRIRFAPLPEPRREAFVADEGELPLSSVAADDSAIIDARKNVSPGSFSLKNQQTKWHSAVEANERRTPGDLLFSDGGVGSVNGSAIRLLASESTPTLASTATATSNPNPNIPVPVSASASASSSSTAPSELDGGDWEHRHSTPATPQKSGGDLPSLTDSPRRSASNGSKWSKKLFKPLLAPLSKGASYSVEDVRSTLSNSLPSPEPGSEGCMPGRSRASDPAKERERREEKEKKRSKSKPRERDPEWVREFGMPLYRFASEGDPWGVPLKNKRGEAMTMAEIREAGPEIWRQRERELERQRARSGSGTRMLNGRVYGAKRLANEQARANGRNAFANVRDEPEFVEWGYGGMGSVQAGNFGAGFWARVQAGRAVSIGAHEDVATRKDGAASRGSVGRAGDEEDDGSGMAWVRKRRREKREREEQEKAARGGSPAPDAHPAADANSAVFDSNPLQEPLSESPKALAVPLPEDVPSTPQQEHVLTAVTLPPALRHHHHGHHHSHSKTSMERAPSALMAAAERRDSADTARGMPVSAHVVPEQAGEGAQEAKAEVELVQETEGRARAGSVGSVSTTSSASAIEGEDEAEGAEDESPRDAEDDEDEDDMKDSSRLLALGAGVEKISRHKDASARAGTPVPTGSS